MTCMMCKQLRENMDNINNPVGLVNVKQKKHGTNKLENI